MMKKTILIHGGSRGIGADMVRFFSASGCRVAFTYKNSHDHAAKLAAETGALALYADSAKEADASAAVEKTVEMLGGVDVLVNNAAISSFSLFTDISSDAWKEIFDINVHGAFYFSKAVLPRMISQKKGKIINISSMWGITGASCEVHYSATKAALIGMTKALAKEVGPSGIQVNCVAPGVIDTEMNQALTEEDMLALEEETPLCRIGNVRDVTHAVYFLASEKSDFITGQVLQVNGGFLI